MATQGYVPGPTQIFTKTGAAGAWQFLGYSEDGVQLQLLAAFEDILSDFGGPAVPVDVQFMGEHGYGSCTLNKYDESVLKTLSGRRFGVSVVPGAIEANALGSLMIAQSFAYQVLFLSPYNGLSFQSGSIVPCYLFSAGWLNDDFTVPISVRLKRPRCVFRFIPVWNSITLTATLYTNTLPSPVPTPD